jgi:hypothetical protein
MQECLRAYPELYLEADRAREWHKKNGGISQANVDDAAKNDASARVAIIDNQVGLIPSWVAPSSPPYAATNQKAHQNNQLCQSC